jgi:membrane protein
MKRIRALVQRIAEALSRPEAELDRWERLANLLIRIARHGARQLVRHRAPQMAAALSYRTLFSLVPLLVVALVGARMFFGAGAFTRPLRTILEHAGLDQIRLEMTFSDPTAPQTAGQWIESLAVSVGDRMNFGAIGVVGAALLIYAAISLLLTIEHAFNTIFAASRPRGVFRRLTNYWTLLTLGPAAIILTGLVNQRFNVMVENLGGSMGVRITGVVVTFIMSWLVLMLAYTFVPNRRVRIGPALYGSFVAVLLWHFTKFGFGEYVQMSTRSQQLYGSLGLLPVFLLWVHLTWLVVLFGLELTATLQAVGADEDAFNRYESRRVDPRRALVDPATALVVMSSFADAFSRGQPLRTDEVAEAAKIPDRSAEALIDALTERDLLHRVVRAGEDAPEAYALARSPEMIRAEEVLQIGFELATPPVDGAAGVAMGKLREAQKIAASGWSLASLASAPS